MKNIRVVSQMIGHPAIDPEHDDGSSEIVASPGRITQEIRDGSVLSDERIGSYFNWIERTPFRNQYHFKWD